MKRTLSLMLLIFTIVCVCAYAQNSAKNINGVRKKLIDITREIMEIERDIISTNQTNSLLAHQEKSTLLTILDQTKIGMTLENLRHTQGSSPLLMAITILPVTFLKG